MNSSLPGLIDRFAGLNVIVIGEAMLDSYLEGSADRIAREAPVPIVDVKGRTDAPGGAANTAANISALGARVTFLSVTGDDPESYLLRRALEGRGVIADSMIAVPARRTLAKHRVIASGQMLVRFDQGSTDAVDPETEAALIDRLTVLYKHCDAVMVSDYGYGILTPGVLRALAELQAETPRLLAVDAKDLLQYRDIGPALIKPNYGEAAALLGLRETDASRVRLHQIASEGQRLLDLTGARLAAVTMDVDGALVFEKGAPAYRTYARGSARVRTTGAGDTFLSAITLALAVGANVPTAAELAAAAATVVVGKDGTAVCSAAELRSAVAADNVEKVVDDLSRLAARVEFARRQGQRIVFTNGCFDILHRGHITYLNRAKALGDLLIVGLNTDDSVRRLKGPERPINALEDRAGVLAALSSVDHIVAFAEDTPAELIKALRPDIFVKGGDYTLETLPEAPLVEALGGAVQILPFVEERSTTSIIERIRREKRGADPTPPSSSHELDRTELPSLQRPPSPRADLTPRPPSLRGKGETRDASHRIRSTAIIDSEAPRWQQSLGQAPLSVPAEPGGGGVGGGAA